MKSKIFSFLRISDNSVIPSVRIARIVSQQLKLPLVDDQSVGDGSLNVLFIVNGAFAFCKFLPELGSAIEKARRVVWIQNDYTIIPPKKESSAESPFRKAFRNRFEAGKPDTDFWSTCHEYATLTSGSYYINWNCLTVDRASSKIIADRRKKASNSLLYYGSYRSDRTKAFDRYFNSPTMNVVISSPSKKFLDKYKNPNITHETKIVGDFYDYIGRHGMGLYLEDRRSHREFHSPPNRFYEMLSAGLPIMFQPECGSMLRKAGYDPTPYQAGYPLEVSRVMKRREEIGEEQRKAWLEKILDENASIPKLIKIAAKNLEI